MIELNQDSNELTLELVSENVSFGGGNVEDVYQNGTSVVDANRIAQVTTPTKTSDLTNDGDGTNPFLTTHQSLANYSTTAEMNTAIANHHDSTKQDTLPSVTNDRYLHTNSSTGALEWSEVSAMPMLMGTSEPSSATVGQVGQFYYKTNDYGLFICVSVNPYVWNKVFTNQTTLGTGVVSINTKNNNNGNFVAIGYQSAGGNAGVSIGASTEAYGSRNVVLGYSAKANGNDIVQIGVGQNTTAETMQVWTHRLLNKSNGLIPQERINLIKTTMDSVATIQTQYFLGEQTSVSITMPSSANVGNEILVTFSSGATPCALTCNLQGFSFVPKANKTSWIKFTYCASDCWLVETKEG